jgi:hypothetical protein
MIVVVLLVHNLFIETSYHRQDLDVRDNKKGICRVCRQDLVKLVITDKI